MTSTPSPTTEKIRLTIPVTTEVHQAFQRLAKASGMSTGRAMGEWLADTLTAVEYMADKVEQARQAPRQVAMELHAYALGAAEMTGEFLNEVRQKGRATGDGKRSAAAVERPAPPSGNTGGKGQETAPSKTRARKS